MIERARCSCGCRTFHIDIKDRKKQPVIVCERCSCRRTIQSPGVSVVEYETSIPFATKNQILEN